MADALTVAAAGLGVGPARGASLSSVMPFRKSSPIRDTRGAGLGGTALGGAGLTTCDGLGGVGRGGTGLTTGAGVGRGGDARYLARARAIEEVERAVAQLAVDAVAAPGPYRAVRLEDDGMGLARGNRHDAAERRNLDRRRGGIHPAHHRGENASRARAIPCRGLCGHPKLPCPAILYGRAAGSDAPAKVRKGIGHRAAGAGCARGRRAKSSRAAART